MPPIDLPPFRAWDQEPAAVLPGQRVPLLVFLHGSDEFGGSTEPQVKRHGPWMEVISLQPGRYHPDAIAALRRFQVLGLHGRAAGGDWDGGQVNAAIVAYLGSHPEIDPMRICLTGVSLGGRGVLRTALHRREQDLPVHSCAVFCPVSGGFEGNPRQIARLQTVPIYFFASPKDRSVPYDSTVALQSRIGDQSSRLRTIAPNELRWSNSAHVCWTHVYGHPALYDWLLQPPPGPADWPNMILPYAGDGR